MVVRADVTVDAYCLSTWKLLPVGTVAPEVEDAEADVEGEDAEIDDAGVDDAEADDVEAPDPDVDVWFFSDETNDFVLEFDGATIDATAATELTA